MKLPVSVIILTFNDEKKIKACLESVKDCFENIFVVDSFSTDRTTEIVGKYTDKIVQHEFENYGKQRNWAQDNLPINTEWVFHLDSDHRITNNLRDELIKIFTSNEHEESDAFLIARKTMFMGKWIKHGGHYPVYHAILFKKDFGKCEEIAYDQHFVVHGKLRRLKSDIEDIVTDDLSNFTLRHNNWSSAVASAQFLKQLNSNSRHEINKNIFGSPMEKRRFLKTVFLKMPLFIRPFLYFIYRYFIRLGFLDGKEGLIFHVLQGFWFRFLIDSKIYEIRISEKCNEGKL